MVQRRAASRLRATTSAFIAMDVPGSLREVHAKLQERHGSGWTAEDSAANLVQNQFRRMTALKRVARKRRLNAKHEKLAKLNAESGSVSAWSRSDSMAALLQATFRAKLAKRAVEKATRFVVRARMEFWHSDTVIALLRKPPRDRTEADLEVLFSSFVNLQFVHNMESKLVQLQCCRYLKARSIQCGAVVFKQDDVGDLLYIVLSGCVEYQVDAGKAVLHSGIGDYFGEQSLRGENGGRRDATVTAKEDTLVATLERADYLRLSNELTGEVQQVLKIPGPRRTPIMLRLVRNLFQETPFFRKIHFSVLQRYCCGLMQMQILQPFNRLFQQGDHGEEFFIIIEGKVDVYIRDEGQTEAKLIRTLGAGDSFGELALISDDPAERIRTASIEAAAGNTTAVLLAKLSREAYLDATKRLEKKVLKILATDTEKRTETQIEKLFDFFQEETFFVNLKLDGMRRQCCSTLVLQRVGAGEIIIEQGEIGETFHIMIRGEVRVIVNGNTVRTLGPGASFGEIALLSEDRKRTATVMANEDTLMASMTRSDFVRVQDQKELQSWINKFWVLLTTTITEVGITAEVEWEAYRKLHVRIRKTIAPEFSRKEARAAAKQDWQDDLNRHNKGGHTMNHEQFSNALFELVDVWCEGAPSMLMYIEFLRMVFLNVTLLGRKKGHLQPKQVMKKVEDVSCLSTQLESMRTSLTERFNLEEERAEKDRQILAQHANIGMVASEMYVESASGKLWVNAKSLVKSALRAGIFKEDDLQSADHSDSSSSSESSSESEEEERSNQGSLKHTQSGPSAFGSLDATQHARGETVGSPQLKTGSQADLNSLGLEHQDSAAVRLSPTPEQRRQQLVNTMDDMQARLAGGVFTSSEELESAIVDLQMMNGSDLRWAGMEEEHMQMLEELETQFAMKYAAETGTCYVPPDPGVRRRRRKVRKSGHNHWGRMDSMGRHTTRRGMPGMNTWRDESWAPKQVWAQSLLSQQPVSICHSLRGKPPRNPRHVPRSSTSRVRIQHGQQNCLSSQGKQITQMTQSQLPSRLGRASTPSARQRLTRAHSSQTLLKEFSVRMGQMAPESTRWFELETKAEGSRRPLTQSLPIVPVEAQQLPFHGLPPRPSTSTDANPSHVDSMRPMSSYTNACLQVSRGGSHPSTFCQNIVVVMMCPQFATLQRICLSMLQIKPGRHSVVCVLMLVQCCSKNLGIALHRRTSGQRLQIKG